MQKYAAVAAALVWLLFATGCGGIRVASQVANTMLAGNDAAGLALLEKEKPQYSGPNNLLYYFERGTLLQRTGDLEGSIKSLGTAEDLIEQLYGTSVSQAAVSFLVNDMTMDYTGEDFEQVMVNVVKGLDFLYGHDLEGALVEARKVNTRLTKLAGKYGNEAVYQDDGFARYLSAFIHEADREYNDAYIDYKLAFKDFQRYRKYYGMPVPRLIQSDLIRLSRWLGFTEDFEQWRKVFGSDLPAGGTRPKKISEILVVVYDGIIPEKHTRYIETPIPDGHDHAYLLKVAFPVLLPRPNVVKIVRLGLPDGTTAESEWVEPLAEIAIQNLEQRIGLISAKAIARATAKYIATAQARKLAGDSPLAGLAANIFTYMTEQADTRSWRTLPNRFHLLRVPLAPGPYHLEVRVETMRGDIRPALPIVGELKEGEKKVVPVYVAQ